LGFQKFGGQKWGLRFLDNFSVFLSRIFGPLFLEGWGGTFFLKREGLPPPGVLGRKNGSGETF